MLKALDKPILDEINKELETLLNAIIEDSVGSDDTVLRQIFYPSFGPQQ